MKEFDVTITETLKLTVSVEASSKEEAEQMVNDQWRAGDHVLDADNFVDVEFESNDGKEISAEREPEENAKDTIEVLMVEPGQYPRMERIGADLASLQKAVDGDMMDSERTGFTMKFILKILLAPVMLIVWLFECACKLALKLSSVVFVLASILFAAASIFYFTQGSVLNGCIGLVIAFLLSPYGLPMLAVKLLAWFIAMRMLLKERIYG